MADERLRTLERQLRASGLEFKVLGIDELRPLRAFLTKELDDTRLLAQSDRVNKLRKARAFERMNNIATLLEVLL